MGLAIAEALANAGARVILVLGPTALRVPKKIRMIPVVSALEMRSAVMKHINRAHALVATAAVSDWRFSSMKNRKMKKGNAKDLRVTLVRNPDILADVGRIKKKNPRPVLIGFSLETSNVKNFALKKLAAKNLDLIIANLPETFASEKIRGFWIERPRVVRPFSPITKKQLASQLTSWLSKKLATSIN